MQFNIFNLHFPDCQNRLLRLLFRTLNAGIITNIDYLINEIVEWFQLKIIEIKILIKKIISEMYSGNRSAGKSRLPSLESVRHRSASVGLHSRDSYGIARRASSEERKSGNGSNRRWSNARNSLSNNNDAKGVIKDTRPLTDKNYQKKKVNELFEFLEENNFSPSISQSKLMSPSKKEYEMIFQFLVRYWEPSFEVKNLEEDALRILKVMKYPFIPNKSVFTYVARTNFATLLGILSYLMDFAKFIISIDLKSLYMTGDSERPQEHQMCLDLIFKSYIAEESEENVKKVFEQIILSRFGGDFQELEEINAVNIEKLQAIEGELNQMEQIQKEIELQESRCKQYEKYFLEMQQHKEKKLSTLNELSETLKQKESDLNGLLEKLNAKQAIYDAQGFDGKKTLSHFEDQKKELNEVLQRKRATLREVQNECWELEMQHSSVEEKVAESCKEFNQMYISIEDFWKMACSTLQNIKDPGAEEILKTELNIPQSQLLFSHQMLTAWSNTQREALEEIQKTVSKTNIVFKTLLSAKSEELTRIEMKKLQLSAKLKCAYYDEEKKKEELTNLEKQAVEEVKKFEKMCDEKLEQLNKLRNENADKALTCSKLKSDLQYIEKMKLDKMLMLDTYLKHQKEYFNNLLKKLEDEANETEKMEGELYTAAEQLIKQQDTTS